MLNYFSQSGPHHPKHGGGSLLPLPSQPLSQQRPTESILQSATKHPPLHPFLAFCIHYAFVIPTTFLVHDAFFDANNTGYNDERHHHRIQFENIANRAVEQRQTQISKFLLFYVTFLFGTRYLSSYHAGRLRQHAVLYELTWFCNCTLVFGFLSFGGLSYDMESIIFKWFFRRRPLVATSCCVAVSIDQVLWYVDLVVWLISGKFPIGVIKYLTWKQTLWIDRLTCTHHLWTIPLLIYGANKLTIDSYFMSIYIVVIHVLLSRWLTPHCIEVTNHMSGGEMPQKNVSGDNKADPCKYRYLNVNLSHELWKDIQLDFLQISKDDPPCGVYLFRLLWRWQFLNYLLFVGVLYPLSKLIIAKSTL